MATNPDFRDLLFALCAEDAEFIIVGAHAERGGGCVRREGKGRLHPQGRLVFIKARGEVLRGPSFVGATPAAAGV